MRNPMGMKRRDFICGAFGLASSGLMRRGPAQETRQGGRIIYRTLGRTGLRLPILSFGVMNSDSPDLISRALDMGITHLDTAHLYLRGNSELVIGRVVEQRKARNKVILATKMRFNRDREKPVFLLEAAPNQPAATAENLYKQLDISLGRLRTDYVDILYLHSCYSPEMALFEPLMNALVKVKREGKARFIGVSTHRDEPNVIRAAVDSGVYDVVLTAYNYLLERREDIKKAIAYAAEKGVGVVAMKTQGGNDLQEEGKVAINHKAALKWVLNDANVTTTIPGMTTFRQLETNFATMTEPELAPSERLMLERDAVRSGLLFCQNCRACVSSCANSVEVPHLVRAYMYARSYGNLSHARTTLEELPSDKGLEICRTCVACTVECRRGIPVGRRIGRLIDEGFLG